MKKTVGPLKHFRRKKFFYRLFWRKSPRNAALFGLSCHILFLVLLPSTIFWYLFPKVLDVNEPSLVFMLVISFSLMVFCYCIMILGCAYASMLRHLVPWKIPRITIAGLAALFYPLGNAILFFVLFAQKKRLLAACCVTGIMITAAIGLLWLSDYIFELKPIVIYVIWWLSIMLMTISIAGLQSRYKFQWRILWPLGMAFFVTFGTWGYEEKLKYDIARYRNEISQMLGHSVELEDFWKRQEKGFPLGAEPLSTLIAKAPEKISFRDYTWSIDDYKRELAEFEKNNPDFCQAVNELIKLPPQTIEHEHVSMLFALLLPEANALRTGARYLALKLIANSEDRDKVLQYDKELKSLRDWCIADITLIGKLVAIAVEGIRLKALSYPLAQGTLTDDDWQSLLSQRPDWGKALADAMGDEVTLLESLVDEAVIRKKFFPDAFQVKITEYLPIWFPVYFYLDYRYASGECKKSLELFLCSSKLTATERSKRMEQDEEMLCQKAYIFSYWLLPIYPKIYLKHGAVEDYYRLVEIGVAVMDYRNAHGKLPESLDFLPEKPLDSLNRLPIMYEQGSLKIMGEKREIHTLSGFRLYSRDADGKDPGGLKAKNTFTVILP